MDLSQFFNILEGLLVTLGAGIASLYTLSKKFRKWINGKLRDTESIKELNKKQNFLENKENELENNCLLRKTEMSEMCETINRVIKKLDEFTEKDNKSTLLSLKCQILDICSRASRYGGITRPDKELLCELYHEYVDVWKQNHYVKSEADKVISNAKIIDDYKSQV